MPYYQKLPGKRCYLSPCSAADADNWARWENDLRVAIPLGDEAYMLSTLEQNETRIREIVAQQQHVFSIIDLASDRAVGRVMLFNVDHLNQTAMLGLMIGETSEWGKGYGHEALALILDYGFNLLNLHNIMLGVFAFNTRAIALYQKLGFRVIGRRRQVRQIGGKRYDALLMELLAEEFRSSLLDSYLPTAQPEMTEASDSDRP